MTTPRTSDSVILLGCISKRGWLYTYIFSTPVREAIINIDGYASPKSKKILWEKSPIVSNFIKWHVKSRPAE